MPNKITAPSFNQAVKTIDHYLDYCIRKGYVEAEQLDNLSPEEISQFTDEIISYSEKIANMEEGD